MTVIDLIKELANCNPHATAAVRLGGCDGVVLYAQDVIDDGWDDTVYIRVEK